jgi:hypothetical protein
MLRRRRDLVVLSAELQRATLVRRLDRVERHPLRTVLAFAGSAAALPVLWNVGSSLAGMAGARRERPRGSRFALLRWLPMLRMVPLRQVLPFLKFLNRQT